MDPRNTTRTDLLTKISFGQRFQIIPFEDSLLFWVFPCRHYFNKSEELDPSGGSGGGGGGEYYHSRIDIPNLLKISNEIKTMCTNITTEHICQIFLV